MQLVNFNGRVARLALVCLLAIVCPTVLLAEDVQYPFPAEVIEDSVSVRAGVGTTYYVVKKLKKGDIVTVDEKIYQWYKIVPPAGVHSYVSKAFVDAKGDGKVGVVNKTPCEVFTASVNGVADSFRRTTNLLKGDTVEIVAEDGGYYKIMPPKGTYVYIPAVSVKQAQFKPAVAETPVAVVKPEPKPEPKPVVAEVTDVKPVTVTVNPTPKPEPITLPDPETTVITVPKPTAQVVDVTTADPKPVVEPVAVVVPTPKPEPVAVVVPEPAPTPVTITSDVPRPLVISKPLPGDELPSKPEPTAVAEVSSTPKPVVRVVPTSHDRVVPPIPDTETPPDFEGLPKFAADPSAKPVAPVVSPVLNTPMPDTTLPVQTQELVVDKPAVSDRLDETVPSKPELPVVADGTQLKPTPPMPSFPVVMPEVKPESSTLAEVAVPESKPQPVVMPEVVPSSAEPTPAPALAPKPKVNPLLATRMHFQAKSATLAELEQKMIDAHQLPLDKRPLDELLSEYQTLAGDAQLSIGDQRIIQARVVQLKRDINLANALKSIGAARTDNAAMIAQEPVTTVQEPAQPTAKQYDMVGQLLASALYDGRNLPRLYRLVNPANPTITLIYVRPNANVNAAAHLGQMVGINGVTQVDDALNLKLVDPQEVELYKAQ